jgi:antitoxin (DNA-binding transcriptional repressor) of toxin-antitoxin stability system
MNFFTSRELEIAPKQVWDSLNAESEVVITNNEKPSALMIPVDETNFDEVLATVRQASAMRTVTRMQLAAAKAGLNKLSLEEINAEINAVREKCCD